jgi:hypothetical protein
MKYISNIIIALSLAVLAVYILMLDSPEYRVYDCGMAEWHPDIPVEVKEECRKLRSNEWQKQQPEKINHEKYTT